MFLYYGCNCKLTIKISFCFTGDFVKNQLKCVFNLLPAFQNCPVEA